VVTLIGIHTVLEALKAGRTFDRVIISRGTGGQRIQEVIDLCRSSSVPVRFEPRSALDRLAGSNAHQGVLGIGSPHRYASLEDLPAAAELVVILDGVEDPHNLGAIVRTAHSAGAAAVIIPERRAAGITEVVAKAAAGALEHLPIIRVTNVSRAAEDLKQRGFWIYGVDERGENLYCQTSYATPTAFVLGGEGHGLHHQVREQCDMVVRIPMNGKIASLNVSVAAGVVLFEWRRRRDSGEY
jgi:23S rRNA (guanosine2251-2'-O)-methyltransferase